MGLVCTYPLFKRVTWWPQLVLGMAFNWGALLGWAAVMGSSNWAVTGPLYAAGISWTLVYDTIYALQDIRDDEKVGIKSTARRCVNKWQDFDSFSDLEFASVTRHVCSVESVASLVSRFGANTRLWLTGFSATTVAGLALAGANAVCKYDMVAALQKPRYSS